MSFVPGRNLLNVALRVIRNQTPLMHRAFLGRTRNAAGLDVPTYAPAVEIVGSMQSISNMLFLQLGLDRQKRYMQLYTSATLHDVERDGMGDLIEYDGMTFRCQSALRWAPQDGWTGMLLVEVPAERDPIEPSAGVYA